MNQDSRPALSDARSASICCQNETYRRAFRCERLPLGRPPRCCRAACAPRCRWRPSPARAGCRTCSDAPGTGADRDVVRPQGLIRIERPGQHVPEDELDQAGQDDRAEDGEPRRRPRRGTGRPTPARAPPPRQARKTWSRGRSPEIVLPEFPRFARTRARRGHSHELDAYAGLRERGRCLRVGVLVGDQLTDRAHLADPRERDLPDLGAVGDDDHPP
jgi:hypothetical protein